MDDSLIGHAADLTEAQALRAYDAVHLAAALQVVEADLVLVAGDRALLTVAESVGLMVAASDEPSLATIPARTGCPAPRGPEVAIGSMTRPSHRPVIGQGRGTSPARSAAQRSLAAALEALTTGRWHTTLAFTTPASPPGGAHPQTDHIVGSRTWP
ncbi:MAG TPA: hypothetical protein VGR26_12395 [Acidimicrobiales bacterium]|nr:hypothetical protein [Acidimicrobiales bacterium]